MTNMSAIFNAAQRRLDSMFPRFFSGSVKHNHYRDFGWPDELTFDHLYRMYRRNSLAAAAVDKTVSKTWQDTPEIWESDKPTESQAESDIRQVFEDMRIWQAMADADRRSMVGRYAGIVLRFRDSKQFHEPVDRVPGGLSGLAGAIPVWESQLIVSEWNTDPTSEEYGTPRMYQFNESAIGSDNPSAHRAFLVHPDRVVIWSDDGTVDGTSDIEPGYNDLLDAEKIKGAGGEGFWKTSRGAPVIEAAQGMSPGDVAQNMGVPVGSVLDEINQQIDNFQSGFDKGLMLGGMTAKPLQITLPSPEHFFAAPVNSFAASMQIPVKILMGSQTGERASTEDAREWALTCHARRNNRCKPVIREFVNRLERFGIIPERDWVIGWADLTEASANEKIERAGKMSDINAKTNPLGEPPFTADEIREAAGYEPLGEYDRLEPVEFENE